MLDLQLTNLSINIVEHNPSAQYCIFSVKSLLTTKKLSSLEGLGERHFSRIPLSLAGLPKVIDLKFLYTVKSLRVLFYTFLGLSTKQSDLAGIE